MGDIIRKVLHSAIYDFFMFIVTLFILTADVIRYHLVDMDHDWRVQALSSFALVLCSIDIGLRYLCEENYANSFFFGMDVMALLAVIWDIVLHIMSDGVWYLNRGASSFSLGETIRVLCLLRIARMARVVTMIDQCSLSFQRFLQSRSKPTILPVNTPQKEGEAEPQKEPQKAEQLNTERSRVSNEFMEMTIRKVIVVIVLVCLIHPLLEPSRMVYAKELPLSYRQGLAQISQLSDMIYAQGQPTDTRLEILKLSIQVCG